MSLLTGFRSPLWLLLLVVIVAFAVVYVVEQLRRKKYVARFSNVSLLASIAPKRPGWRRHVTFALLLCALAVLTVGVAQPTGKVRVPREKATVMLAIDVSLSMKAEDVLPNRLNAAKKAAREFADLLPPKINLGLVAFAGAASLKVPPTIDRDSFKAAVDGLELQSSTAIGEAVYSCLDAINTFTRSTTAKDDKPAPARIVLLSDGTNNNGRSLRAAAQSAKDAPVPVSTIAFGTQDGTVEIEGQISRVPADIPALRGLAQDTGGSFHTAASAQELETVYQDIGSQIGYTTAERDISWRFLAIGLVFAMVAAASGLLWSGRLV
ncbi:MAG: VWA domain-containing protein [bacterium]